MQYKTISLFSGGMGLDLGMHMTGRFELLAAVEHRPINERALRPL
jgi:DNA (cytosine-5)-methyltransferase 1